MSLNLIRRIEKQILLIRGQKVMLDRDLAALYGVSTRDLNKAVSRNLDRFPSDFMIQLTHEDLENLMFQNGTSRWGGTRKPPRAFTEHGVAMLSSVLRSRRAIHVNISIVRTFAKLRELLIAHRDLARRLDDLEQRYDSQFKVVFDAIRGLMAKPSEAPPAEEPEKRMGFHES